MAAGSTYSTIATTTLGSAAASYTFSSISGSYTDLVLIVAGTGATAAGNVLLQFNSDTGTNYSATILAGDGTSAVSARTTSATSINIGDLDTGTAQSVTRINFMNYSNSTTYKTVIGRGDRSALSTAAKIGLWRSTAAITSITVFLSGSVNLASGTNLTLYGIAAA